MASGVLTFIVFLLALGGMIFLHELGHFLAARWAKIEVEEFGFGFPPRAFGFWRAKGFLLFNQQRVEIPKNFDLGFDWQMVVNQPSKITVDQQDEKYVLRSLEFEVEEESAQPTALNRDQIVGDANGNVIETPAKAESKKETVRVGKENGAIQWHGAVNEIHVGTLFSINWLPLGGFVRPKGENDPNVAGGLASANPWKRLVVLYAGPVMNIVTAIVVFSLWIGQAGIPTSGPIGVTAISPNSPAERAGLKSGDTILALNGTEVSDIEQAIGIIQANLDQPVEIRIKRGAEQLQITATPLSTRTKQEGALGVSLISATRNATFKEALTGGATLTALQGASLVYIPIALIQGVIAPDQARVIGFKGIYDLFGVAVQEDVQSRQQIAASPSARERPSNWTLQLIGVLSVSLGVMNLLPIPALDGGRILFTLPEIVFRKRIPPEWENRINGTAMALLILLMLVINAMDFINPAKLPIP